MTFSQKVKSEIVKLKLGCDECSFSFLRGVFMLHKLSGNTVFMSDNKCIVDYVAENIVEVTGAIVTLIGENQNKSGRHYRLAIESEYDLDILNQKFSDVFLSNFDTKDVSKQCCKIAFLRGAFLCAGIIVNPQKEYHLEFKFQGEEQCDLLHDFLSTINISFKKTIRKGNYILYIKESEQIENFLTYLGAFNSSFELMNIKIEKDLRNKVNRQTNCETANLEKTAKAALKKNKDIKYIIDTKGIEFLPEELQDVALLRIMNPELSLSELASLLPQPISRSGLNHRLTKLQKIAKELKENL